MLVVPPDVRSSAGGEIIVICGTFIGAGLTVTSSVFPRLASYVPSLIAGIREMVTTFDPTAALFSNLKIRWPPASIFDGNMYCPHVTMALSAVLCIFIPSAHENVILTPSTYFVVHAYVTVFPPSTSPGVAVKSVITVEAGCMVTDAVCVALSYPEPSAFFGERVACIVETIVFVFII